MSSRLLVACGPSQGSLHQSWCELGGRRTEVWPAQHEGMGKGPWRDRVLGTWHAGRHGQAQAPPSSASSQGQPQGSAHPARLHPAASSVSAALLRMHHILPFSSSSSCCRSCSFSCCRGKATSNLHAGWGWPAHEAAKEQAGTPAIGCLADAWAQWPGSQAAGSSGCLPRATVTFVCCSQLASPLCPC